jgi:hypothetical protein
MIHNKRQFRAGITLVELMIAMVAGLIVLLTAGLLMASGLRGWKKAYDYAYGDVQVNALETMVAFGKTGRMANKSDYVLYKVTGSTFTGPVLPSAANPEEVVFGEAVEFRYWDTDLSLLSENQQKEIMKTDVTGTAYALFYVEGGVLKVDRGAYPPGGVDASGKKRNPSSTQILAKNVQSVQFSHTTKDTQGDGQGCVRMRLKLYDSSKDQGITVETATLLRNVWP